MDKDKLFKNGLTVLGMVLAGVATLVGNKQQKNTIKEEVAKEVAKVLSEKAKES